MSRYIFLIIIFKCFSLYYIIFYLWEFKDVEFIDLLNNISGCLGELLPNIEYCYISGSREPVNILMFS